MYALNRNWKTILTNIEQMKKKKEKKMKSILYDVWLIKIIIFLYVIMQARSFFKRNSEKRKVFFYFLPKILNNLKKPLRDIIKIFQTDIFYENLLRFFTWNTLNCLISNILINNRSIWYPHKTLRIRNIILVRKG